MAVPLVDAFVCGQMVGVMIDFCSRRLVRGPALALLLTTALGCSEAGGDRPIGYGSASTGSGAATSAATTAGATATQGTGGGSSSNATTGGASTGAVNVPLPTGTDTAALLPTRVRRLSNAEYDATAANLLGTKERLAESFAPDSRQAGFTVNDAQRVDTVLVKQLFAAAETLAVEARSRFGELAPCNSPDMPEACATAFIQAFGARAYRRPLDSVEVADLLAVFAVGAAGASYEDGIELTIRALLQSAGFLYLTELGGGVPDDSGAVTLTPHELASSLSYLVTAGPPDQTLIDAATSGQLASSQGRVEQVLRLRAESKATSDTRLIRLVREWLSLDRIETTAKDSNVYPGFGDLKPAVVAENHAFIGAVLDESQGSISALLGADWTVTADQNLIGLYSGTAMAANRISLPTRRGILNQAAFLAVHAHAHESTPVLRGVAIGRRLACLSIPSPATLNLTVTPPIPDPNLTTRERFAAHTADAACAQCHSYIDPFGNAFEQFDGMGQHRGGRENNRDVDASTTISVGADFDGSYADSNQLAEALAASAEVRACFARHLFRAASARSDSSVAAAEDAFVAELAMLPNEQQGNLMDTLIAYVNSPVFTHRRAQ